jgi:hypothetical protein
LVKFYNALTSRLLFPRAISSTTGFSTFTIIAGELKNKGIEATVNVEVV